jgi:hypothetical protein
MGQSQSQSRLMIWALLLLIGAVVAIHWFDYARTVEEYTFAQPAGMADICPTLLNDKTPIVVEVGALPWRPEVAGVSSWAVETEDGAEMPVSLWVSQEGSKDIMNGSALTREMGLDTGLGELEGSRPFWWLPGFHGLEVGVLRPDEKLGLSWIGAERRWIGCSAGEPLVLWLVHSRYRRFLPTTVDGDVDPWKLTVAEAPWIGRVQFVEVRVRPGWCVGLPAHWGVAVRTESEKAETSSWWWQADQHSPLSLGLSRLL